MTPSSTSPVLLVTGGGRGIGAATARLAAQRGYAVAVNYAHNASAAEQLVADIRADGGKAIAVQADIADEAQVLRLFACVDAELGPLQALVNNAGVVDAPARVEAMDLARLQRMFSVNVIGSFLCAREAVRRMGTRLGERNFGPGYGRGGAIVNVSSAASRLGSPGQYVDYAAAKGAIDSMTLGLAKEVAADGIRVNAVRPGLIETEIHASGGLPDRVRDLSASVPLQRGGTALEVAHAILWLLSPESSYTTGALVDVSGGR
ncbi:MAG: SDR family oxidoreductase [Rhodoferax sp.]|uniref:SDR family oxidoreductase n=1 Tax=Rhodoferax sp. TaxID=50421 RepID=UPI003265B5C5